MAFSFNELNLGGVDVAGSSSTLKPGRYQCKVTDVALRDTRSGGKQVEVSLEDVASGQSVRHWINVHVPSSEQATRIGREQLKALLTFGGHTNPDKPSDINSLKGLKPGVIVVQQTYNKDGEERTGSAVKGYFDPAEIGKSAPAAGATSGGAPEFSDDIPF
jgi:hypothetical protein